MGAVHSAGTFHPLTSHPRVCWASPIDSTRTVPVEMQQPNGLRCQPLRRCLRKTLDGGNRLLQRSTDPTRTVVVELPYSPTVLRSLL